MRLDTDQPMQNLVLGLKINTKCLVDNDPLTFAFSQKP